MERFAWVWSDDDIRRDDNDPAVIRQKRIDDLEFADRVAANVDEIIAIIVAAEGREEAMDHVGELLGASPEQAHARLSRFSLFRLTRAAQTQRTEKLRQLRGEPGPQEQGT